MANPADEGAAAADDTVCSFCGMSHLMYGEMRTKERTLRQKEAELNAKEAALQLRDARVTLLEGRMRDYGLVVPPADYEPTAPPTAGGAVPVASARAGSSAEGGAGAGAGAGSGTCGGSGGSGSGGGGGGRPSSSAATRAHYEQLQQMQETCAQRLATVTELEAKLKAAEKDATAQRQAVADAEKVRVPVASGLRIEG